MVTSHSLYSRRKTLALFGGGALTASLGGDIAASAKARAPVRTRFGVNAIRLFLDGLATGKFDTTQLDALGALDIPFVRFAGSGHWAGDWARYEADPQRCWKGMDTLFAAAADKGIGLVPTVLWNTAGLAYHCREPLQAWADPASRTREMAKRYTETFVERYDGSPALMIYEFANELNDWVDLPNVLEYWPKPDPTVPSRRNGEDDRLNSTQLRDFVQDFAKTIRKHSSKPISMGSNVPRPNAWHLARGHWNTDSPAQFIEQFRTITAPEIDVLSIHVYEDKYGRRGSTFATLPELLTAFVETAKLDGRTTLLGEFGIAAIGDPADGRRRFTAMIDAIRGAGVAYAAIWNYSPRRFQPEWDIAPDNARAYMLDAIVAANKDG